MLRIAKSSPGVLDLSAVKDEFGLPVTLNGESYRDVPDHEEDNPVLQRVRDMQWVTVTRLLVDASEERVVEASGPPPPEDTTGGLPTSGEPASSAIVPPVETTDEPPALPEVASSAETTENPIVTGEAPAETVDDVVKADGPGKAVGKSDSRKTGRRS
jgi:hypothetical protein